MDTNKNLQKILSPIIKSFHHEGPVVVSVLRDMSVGIYEHLGIASWGKLDKSWMFFDKVIMGPALTKFINAKLSFKEIAEADSRNHWNLGKPEDIILEYFWKFCKAYRHRL